MLFYIFVQLIHSVSVNSFMFILVSNKSTRSHFSIDVKHLLGMSFVHFCKFLFGADVLIFRAIDHFFPIYHIALTNFYFEFISSWSYLKRRSKHLSKIVIINSLPIGLVPFLFQLTFRVNLCRNATFYSLLVRKHTGIMLPASGSVLPNTLLSRA